MHSGTAALEAQALLAQIEPGDEVIVPSYTFVSTANAFVLRGAVPVFVDIRSDTLNLDETLIEAALTDRTRAILPVHYAGVACEMDAIMRIARQNGLLVLEDAAQGLGATYKGMPLGRIGDLGAISFHETKNIMCGEGGALFINRPQFQDRAEIIREKGTNRSRFFRGQVDKYTWMDLGSSYLPSDLMAAVLYANLEVREEVMRRRLELWHRYYDAFAAYEGMGIVRRPVIPQDCAHNGHIFYLLMRDGDLRTRFIEYLKSKEILSVFHYIPLHSAPAGIRYGRCSGLMTVTDRSSETLVRLPLFFDLSNAEQERVIEVACDFLEQNL